MNRFLSTAAYRPTEWVLETMSSNDRRSELRRYWDRHASGYDPQMRFMEPAVLGEHRDGACSQATGEVLEVAVGTASISRTTRPASGSPASTGVR